MKTFSTIKATPKYYHESYYKSDQASDHEKYVHREAPKWRARRRSPAYSFGSSLDYNDDPDYDDMFIWDDFGAEFF